MIRHALMAGVGLLGCAIVLSQLQKQRIESPPHELVISDDVLQTVRFVDAEFASNWQSRGLTPAKRADNLLIARRLSLALTGRLPSLEEIRAFEALPTDEQIGWWLNRMLTDRRYSDYVAERLARAFVGTEAGDFVAFRRRRFVSWLSDQLFDNRPYDEIVRALIGDRGSWTAKPAVNFITVTNGTDEEGQPDEARLAARTTRAFLGVRLDCMQCHDDNLGGNWLQSDFHHLAAYFSEARSSGLGIQDVDRDYEFTYLNQENSEVVDPEVPFFAELASESSSRRRELAEWVTHPKNLAFARATVNRMWALLFGQPLVDPIDDIPLEGPYPPGLELLAQDFADNGFDLRRLIVQIANTRTFQLDSRATGVVTSDHETYWAVFPLTRLRPEQVAGCIVQSASLPTIDSNSHIVRQLISFAEVGDFVKRYGDTGEDEFNSRGGTIPQRLVMLNGKLVKERTKDDLLNSATRIAGQVADDERAVNAIFLVVLTRQPTTEELSHFVALLRDKDDDTSRVHRVEDMFWSLLNSAEFGWNH